MLVMKRRAGETILIGEDIRIHITEIGRTRVKLAIDAPRNLSIVPQELRLTGYENAAAATNPAEHLRALAARLTARSKTFSQAPPSSSDEEFRPDLTDN